MQEVNVLCRELMSLNIQAVPTQQRRFQWDMLYSMPFIVTVGTGIYFQTLKSKASFRGKYQKATAILTNLIYDWNFKNLTPRLLEHTIKDNTLSILWGSCTESVCVCTRVSVTYILRHFLLYVDQFIYILRHFLLF